MNDYTKQFDIKTYSIREWKKKFASKDFSDSGLYAQLEAGWYYFDCPFIMLKRKTKIFAQIIKFINERCFFDINKHAVMFVNTIDSRNTHKDEMRIYNIASDEVLFSVERVVEIDEYKVYSADDDFKSAVSLRTEEEVADYLMGVEEDEQDSKNRCRN